MSTTKCSVTLYYDTGLSPRVTLLRANELDKWSKRLALEDVYFTRDSIYKGSIRLNQPVSKVESADIIKIHVVGASQRVEDYYYDVLSANALSADTTEVQVQIDPILSLGGAVNISFAYGHITRGHTYKDEVTVSPEPYIFNDNLEQYGYSPLAPIENLDGDVVVDYGEDFIVSSMALDQMDEDSTTSDPLKWFFGNKEVGYNLNRVRLPQIARPTKFLIKSKYTTDLGNLEVFERTDYTRASLDYLVGLAYDDPVYSEYKIPSQYIVITKSPDNKGGIISIAGRYSIIRTGTLETNITLPQRLRDFCPEGIAKNALANPKNRKILKCYSAIVATVRATGQTLMYSGADLKSWGQFGDPKRGLALQVWCDPTPGGRNYLTFDGVANSGGPLTRSLASEGWQKPTVKTETSFGYTLAERQISAEIFSRFCDVAGALALTAGLGVAGALGAGAGDVMLNAEATGTSLSFGERTVLSGAQGLGDLATSKGAKQLASSQMIQGVGSAGSIPGAYARKQDLEARNFGTVMQIGNNNGCAIISRNVFDLYLYAPRLTDIWQLDYMFNTYGYTQYTDVVQLQNEVKKGPEGKGSVFALRPNFTYLQIPDCVIRYAGSKSNTRNVTALAEEQFKAGVFIQRKIPELGKEDELIKGNYYEDNGG